MTFKEQLAVLGGFWEWKPGAKYLALLASGKIGDMFYNTGVMTTNPGSLMVWADLLYEKLAEKLAKIEVASDSLAVIGPGMGGITLAYELARIASEDLILPMERVEVRTYFTEPAVLDCGRKEQNFRFELKSPLALLFCEDVITTGGSVQKTIDAVLKSTTGQGGPEGLTLLPVVACLVDRRAEKGPLVVEMPNGKQRELTVVSLLSATPRTWDTLEAAQKDCPGVIEALRPKANWAKLVAG